MGDHNILSSVLFRFCVVLAVGYSKCQNLQHDMISKSFPLDARRPLAEQDKQICML